MAEKNSDATARVPPHDLLTALNHRASLNENAIYKRVILRLDRRIQVLFLVGSCNQVAGWPYVLS